MIKKCPSCGKAIDDLAMRCSNCDLFAPCAVFFANGDSFSAWREAVLEMNEATIKRIEEQIARIEAEKTISEKTKVLLPNKTYIGDIIHFGQQNGKIIDWKVLDVQDSKAFIISNDIICNLPYHETEGFITWKDCTLRKWLNSTFYDECFSLQERKRILNCKVTTEAEPENEGQEDISTIDNIFLLSIKDAERLLLFLPKSEELDDDELDDCDLLDENSWWLRTAGPSCFASCVDYFGDVEVTGDFINKKLGVHPVLWISLDPDYSGESGLFKHELKTEPQEALAEIDKKISELENKIARLEGKSCEEKTSTIIPLTQNVPNVGDNISFGVDTTGRIITWKVLKVNNDKALIISRYNICSMPYHEAGGNITWKDCSLRKWLNNDFINMRFTQAERERILSCDLINENNPKYFTAGGEQTTDKVFLLSISEANELFSDDGSRTNGSWWWLRSPGNRPSSAAYVYNDGKVYANGFDVKTKSYNSDGVRPALWISFGADDRNGDTLKNNSKIVLESNSDSQEHRKLIIVGEKGVREEVEVIIHFEFKDTRKEYLIYTKNEKDADGNVTVYCSSVDRSSGEPKLLGIDDENEWKRVQEVLNELSKTQ